MKTSASKAAKPKYPIGTHLQKNFLGYGIWEGCITSFDGEDYEVVFDADNYIEFIGEEDMEDIIAKSNKYVRKKVKVQSVQNKPVKQNTLYSGKRYRIETDRYAPPNSLNIKQEQTASKPSFSVDQHVWVSVGREMHSAKVKEILASNLAKVQWTTMLTYANVSIDDIKPMFVSNGFGDVVPSKFSRRKRGQTKRFVPPLPTKQEHNATMTTTSMKKVAVKCDAPHRSDVKKKQHSKSKSKSKRRSKKAASKLAKAVTKLAKKHARPRKQYAPVKQEPRLTQLPKQKSRKELRLEKEKEEEYKTLWDIYLEPKVRKNEELPGGMCLRQKTATCGLLRCKTSVFRKQLYKTIIHLEKKGKKKKIHRILTQMREHDVTGAAGDGPKELVKEILNISDSDNDEVAFIAHIPAKPRVKRECRFFDVETPQRNERVNAATFEPILAMGSVGMEQDKKRPICSPSVVDSVAEPKRFKRTEESIDLSTVSSLTFPGGDSCVSIPPIPTEITIRRRAKHTQTKALISLDARDTQSTVVASFSSTNNGQTMSQALNSEKKKTGVGGTAECIVLSKSND
eukprot:CAMPEP_0201726198 /NCGR_PEP_ID=MMETSP0593-20130828/9318_1 /ASSEMBLY_ACC=CAM_ASM_000672 /TAXON_ID=267983 /ORGANISM="Skeletonema japonicum, Strain CCMP2506" /LENGTH=568 /DNA_ID=CAMNT_0048217667 /DNA_START=123 /DNA_END=1829 /DNA_ORIENTATION=-